MLSNAGDRWPTVTGTLLPISKFCVAVVLHRPYGRRTDCRNRPEFTDVLRNHGEAVDVVSNP
jgi:hypothetical protein